MGSHERRGSGCGVKDLGPLDARVGHDVALCAHVSVCIVLLGQDVKKSNDNS